MAKDKEQKPEKARLVMGDLLLFDSKPKKGFKRVVPDEQFGAVPVIITDTDELFLSL